MSKLVNFVEKLKNTKYTFIEADLFNNSAAENVFNFYITKN